MNTFLDKETIRQLLERADQEWHAARHGKYDCDVDIERITSLREPVINHICHAELDFLAEYLVTNYGESSSYQVPF